MPSPDTDRADLDIVEMPAKAVAAYWLSLKKLMDSRKGARVVQEEMAAVTEPDIRLLLETAFGSSLPEEAVRRLYAAHTVPASDRAAGWFLEDLERLHAAYLTPPGGKAGE